jgi:hypothetical protein
MHFKLVLSFKYFYLLGTWNSHHILKDSYRNHTSQRYLTYQVPFVLKWSTTAICLHQYCKTVNFLKWDSISSIYFVLQLISPLDIFGSSNILSWSFVLSIIRFKVQKIIQGAMTVSIHFVTFVCYIINQDCRGTGGYGETQKANPFHFTVLLNHTYGKTEHTGINSDLGLCNRRGGP